VGALGATDTSLQGAARTAPDLAKERDLIKAVKAMSNSNLIGENSELTFVFDRHVGRVLVRIVDKLTRKTVMQVPPEYILRMAEGNRG
jgi:uncharacterized FlaG/YvyC family protein